MKTIILLFGGKSSEYEVSLSSANAAYNNINKSKYNVLTVGISREGRFFLFDDDPSMIAADTWMNGRKYPVSIDLADGCMTYLKDGTTVKIDADAVLPMIHGKFCEDGTLQGMFAVAGIPVVGCDCQSSAVCMDKAVTKAIIGSQTSIRQAKAVVVRQCGVSCRSDADAIRVRCEAEVGYPMFVKPARAGSSVGVTKVKSADKFADALFAALAEDSKVLIEEYIEGVEIEVAVLEENGVCTVAHPAEIEMGSAEFYDYETKYVSDASRYYLPARLSEEKMNEVRGYAETIFRALDCGAFARVDFFYTKSGKGDGEFVFNEINTLPGFTPISMYPKMMMNEGISYDMILERLIGTARKA